MDHSHESNGTFFHGEHTHGEYGPHTHGGHEHQHQDGHVHAHQHCEETTHMEQDAEKDK